MKFLRLILMTQIAVFASLSIAQETGQVDSDLYSNSEVKAGDAILMKDYKVDVAAGVNTDGGGPPLAVVSAVQHWPRPGRFAGVGRSRLNPRRWTHLPMRSST